MSQQFVHAYDSSRGHQDTIWALQWTTAEHCLSGGADGKLLIWNTAAANEVPFRVIQHHPLALISLSENSEGTKVLSNSIEGTTSLYDVQSGELLGRHESFERVAVTTEPVWSVSLSPNGLTYAGSNASGTVTIHSAEKDTFGTVVQTLSSGRTKFGLSVAHSPDAKRIALSSETGALYVFDIESSTLTATFSSHAMTVRALAWSPDSQLLLSGSDDKRLVLHDVRTSAGGKPGSGAVASLNGHSSWVLSASVATDGRAAISGSSDRTIKIWDLSQRSCVSTIQEQDEVWGVCWKPTSGLGAGSFVSAGDGCVRFWRSAGSG